MTSVTSTAVIDLSIDEATGAKTPDPVSRIAVTDLRAVSAKSPVPQAFDKDLEETSGPVSTSQKKTAVAIKMENDATASNRKRDHPDHGTPSKKSK